MVSCPIATMFRRDAGSAFRVILSGSCRIFAMLRRDAMSCRTVGGRVIMLL